MSVFDWLKATPTIWAVVAFIFGGAFSFAISWRSLREYNQDLKHERDDYRNNLHAERNAHNAAEMKIAELEARPNLTTLESLFNSLSLHMKTQSESLAAHTESDARIFKSIMESLSSIPVAMREQADAFNQRQKEMLTTIRSRKKG